MSIFNPIRPPAIAPPRTFFPQHGALGSQALSTQSAPEVTTQVDRFQDSGNPFAAPRDENLFTVPQALQPCTQVAKNTALFCKGWGVGFGLGSLGPWGGALGGALSAGVIISALEMVGAPEEGFLMMGIAAGTGIGGAASSIVAKRWFLDGGPEAGDVFSKVVERLGGHVGLVGGYVFSWLSLSVWWAKIF